MAKIIPFPLKPKPVEEAPDYLEALRRLKEEMEKEADQMGPKAPRPTYQLPADWWTSRSRVDDYR